MADDPLRDPSRRRYLSAVAGVAATAAVAGCSAAWDQTGATDVAAHNAANETLTVTVTVTGEGDDRPHTDRTLTLDPGETVEAVNDSKLPTNTGYTVAVSVRNGPSETFEWNDPKVELAPLYVFLDGSDNVDFLLKAG